MSFDEKRNFLLSDYPSILKSINPVSKWGKMNFQQMIEHMTDSVREANGKLPRTLVTTEERLPAMKEFLMSEKEFRPETKNALLGNEPDPVKNKNVPESISALEKELNDFVLHFKDNADKRITNPFFGHLNYDEWTQLLYKHAIHHLKQFGWTAE
jgi:hypothetical protein